MCRDYEEISLEEIANTIKIFTIQAPLELLKECHAKCREYLLTTGKSRIPLQCLPKCPRIIAPADRPTNKKAKRQQSVDLDEDECIMINNEKVAIDYVIQKSETISSQMKPIDSLYNMLSTVAINTQISSSGSGLIENGMKNDCKSEKCKHQMLRELKINHICVMCFAIVSKNALVFDCHDSHVMHLSCFTCTLCRKAVSLNVVDMTLRHICQFCRKIIEKQQKAYNLSCCNGHYMHIDCLKCNLCN